MRESVKNEIFETFENGGKRESSLSAGAGKPFVGLMKKSGLERLIERKQAAKAQRRRAYSLRLMRDYAGQYNCKDCIHGRTGSCTDRLPDGCEYFYDAATGRSFEHGGIAEGDHKERVFRAIKDYFKPKTRKKRVYGY